MLGGWREVGGGSVEESREVEGVMLKEVKRYSKKFTACIFHSVQMLVTLC